MPKKKSKRTKKADDAEDDGGADAAAAATAADDDAAAADAGGGAGASGKKKKKKKKADAEPEAAEAAEAAPAAAAAADDDDDGSTESEASLSAETKERIAKMAQDKVKSASAHAMELTEHSPARGSMVLQRRNTASKLEPVADAVDAAAGGAPPSPALNRRDLKLKRRDSQSHLSSEANQELPADGGGAAAAAGKAKAAAAGAAKAPRTFASDRERCLDLCHRAGLKDFARLVDSKTKYLKKHATIAVDALSQTDANTVGVADGGFKAFLKVASSKDASAAATALWALVTITGIAYSGEDVNTQRQLVEEGGLKTAFALLHADGDSAEVPVAAASLIGNIVLLEESREQVVANKMLKELIDAADDDNVELLRTVLVAVANLASEEVNIDPLKKAGAVAFFLRNAKSDDRLVKQAAMAGLANLANSKCAATIVKKGAIDIATAELAGTDALTVRAAAQTISNLSLRAEQRDAVLAAALKPLIKLSVSRDPRVHHCIAVALNNLAQDDDAREAIIDAGGEPAVKKLMFSVDEDVRSEAEALFKALTARRAPALIGQQAKGGSGGGGGGGGKKKGPGGRPALDRQSSKMFVLGMYEQLKTQQQQKKEREAGKELESMDVLLAKLADYLRGVLPTPDVVVKTVKDVETQAGKNPRNDRAMREAGIQMLVSMLPEFETHPKIVNQVLTTLHVLVRLNPRNILEVAKVDISVEEFLKCLDDDAIDKLNVINLVGALADVENTRNEIVARDGISRFVRILRNPSTPTEVQGSTLEVLAKLAIESEDSQSIIEAKALGVIFNMLSSAQSTDVQCQLLRLLSALTFNNRRLQHKIYDEKKISTIVQYMRSKNYLIQEYAVRALLTIIAGDKRNKEAARVAGADTALHALLASDTDMVLKSSVRCISELALSAPKNKEAFRKAGTLETLASLISTELVVAGATSASGKRKKKGAAAAAAADGGGADATQMPEMIDCTKTTYVLECISVLCNGIKQNQTAFLDIANGVEQIAQLLKSKDLRETYHAIATLGSLVKLNPKGKKALLERLPGLAADVEKWKTHADSKLSHIATVTHNLLTAAK